MASQIKQAVPNAFSHTNKRYEQLSVSKTEVYQPLIDLDVGVERPSGHMLCKQISFADFCRVPFANEIPNFI